MKFIAMRIFYPRWPAHLVGRGENPRAASAAVRGKKKKKYLLTGVEHDAECENVCLCPFRLSPSVLLTGSLQWISLLCVCSLSHSGGRQTRLTPEVTSACLLLCVCLSVFFFFFFLAALSTAYMSLSHLRVRALLCLSAPFAPR